jgi:inosine-uridine nucleoside N-ribohydrolase
LWSRGFLSKGRYKDRTERTTVNACTILDVLERDVPVYAGCGRALIAKDTPNASHVHGQDGLGDSGYPPSKRKVANEHAVCALIRLADASPGELTLVALGPLTNLALATRLDPKLPDKYARLVVMGGAIRGTGIVTPAAEFNAYCDPEAAAIVFDAWSGLTLISYKTILDHYLMAEQVETLMAIDSPHAKFFRHISWGRFEFLRQSSGRQPLPDPWPLPWRWSRILCARPKRTISRSSWLGSTRVARPWWIGSAKQSRNRTSTWYWRWTWNGSGN